MKPTPSFAHGPAALLLAAMFSTSIYFSFRACFQDDAVAPAAATHEWRA